MKKDKINRKLLTKFKVQNRQLKNSKFINRIKSTSVNSCENDHPDQSLKNKAISRWRLRNEEKNDDIKIRQGKQFIQCKTKTQSPSSFTKGSYLLLMTRKLNDLDQFINLTNKSEWFEEGSPEFTSYVVRSKIKAVQGIFESAIKNN